MKFKSMKGEEKKRKRSSSGSEAEEEGEDCENFVHCAVVGDTRVGKTCMTVSYTQRLFSNAYTATVFDNYPVPVEVGGEEFVISLFDTRGHSNHESLRAYTYEKSEVLVLCFSLCDRESFYNVVNSWLPEIQRHSKRRLPLLLVGTQMDLRSSTHTDQVVRHISLRSSDDEDQMDTQTLPRTSKHVDHLEAHLDLTASEDTDEVFLPSNVKTSTNMSRCVTGHLILRHSSIPEESDTDLDLESRCSTDQEGSAQDMKSAKIVHEGIPESDRNNSNQVDSESLRALNTHHQVIAQHLRSSGHPHEVSQAEGQYLAKVIGADCYIECSAKSQEGVQEVFHHVVFSALKYRTKKRKIFNRLFGDFNFSNCLKNFSPPRLFETSCVSC